MSINKIMNKSGAKPLMHDNVTDGATYSIG